MFAHLATAAVVICAALTLSARAYPVPWDGGFSTFGFNGGFFPFAFNSVNAFNKDFFAANFNDDTLYVNNKNANVVSDNVNAFNNVNVIG
ncbi:hypothetical protein IWW45_006164 [Coemansia sp. RSA 485]|nr:hypothetical protein IWW45_006164 [Coemansia sp. RSA 485]KAJ2596774.1 hypothetical protein GGF39_003309 [Coemansia sp. RSA 1721]KAJ2600252.1 hypothetical protein GGF39_001877 [Coemansia sp. RSA 1721]